MTLHQYREFHALNTRQQQRNDVSLTSSHQRHRAQRHFEQRYAASLIDDKGREIPIDSQSVQRCLEQLAGSDSEFICHLARRQAS